MCGCFIAEFNMFYFFQHVNFDQQYVPKGITYYDTAILMDPNPIRTALNVCNDLISKRVSKNSINFVVQNILTNSYYHYLKKNESATLHLQITNVFNFNFQFRFKI